MMSGTVKKLGLYLHVPFCKSKCLYCDFCSRPHPAKDTVERYVTALCRDLEARSEQCRGYEVDTVYFGGGTPTILEIEQLNRILASVFSHYRVARDAEITAECNPATGGSDYFTRMRRAGFNRLSIGLQSAHTHELKALGRLHDFDRFYETWQQARDAGFDNLSADVMSGIPLQSVESYLATLERVCDLSPTHISSYGLIVEEGTPFYAMGERLHLPDEETTRTMYFEGIRYLASRGIYQYEISNFAKEGYESRHNLKYWNCDEYLGLGPAAYSDAFGKRFGNSGDVDAYIDGKEIMTECASPDPRERANEYVMLRMRLCQGVSTAAFEARFGISFEEHFGKALANYIPMGLVQRTAQGYAFTAEGMYVSNAILSEVLDFCGT